MSLSRRNLLKASATLGATLGVHHQILAQEATPLSIPPLASQIDLRLVTFKSNDGPLTRIGVVLDDGHIIDLHQEALKRHRPLAFNPTDMLSLLHAGEAGIEQVKSLTHAPLAHRLHIKDVQLLSPIPRPQSNIYAVGWNYLDHFEEGKTARADKVVKEYPTVPVFFSKGTQTMNGPFDPIPYDASYSTSIDWEAEIAVIIGRRGKNISVEEAMNHVFGYSVYNDTTARDIQQKKHSGQWFKGKSLDGHGPMGPWIVTAGGIDLEKTRVICRVNGVEKQNASYQQMYFKIPTIIAELSRNLTLLPGDIIATGTPSGVGFARTPPEFLKPGDVIETEISTIGVIRNRLMAG